MPDTKITALTAIGVVDASLDPLPIVDTSDTSMAASGTTKKISINQILGAGGAGSFSTLAASGAATLSSTLGVTGATTLTGALTANGNVTLGDALADVVTVNGSLTARNGELASSIRGAASDYAGVAFDGATSGTRVVSTLTSQNIGAGDMSMWNRFKVFTTTGTTRYITSLSSSSTAADQARACLLYINSTGGLVFYLYGATVTDFRYATISGFQSSYSGHVVDIVVTRTGATLKIYINGTDTSYTETTGGTPPAWSDTITSTNLFIGQSGGTSNIFSGPIYRAVLFNRALSATDVVDLIELGVDPADQWGTQTQLIGESIQNGGFETAGAGGADVFADWAEVTSGTSTINRDTSVFYAGTASCRFDLDASGSTANLTSANVDYVRGKRFKASCFARGTATSARIGINVGESSYQPLGAVVDNSSWQYRELEFVCGSSGSTDVVVSRFAGSANGSIWVDNFTVTRIGAIVDLDFTVGAGLQATDRSTNNLHGTLFGGVEFTMPKRMAVLYATTNTNGNQQMLGTLAIPTNAIIEDIVVNSTGTATVSVGNASAGTQIVNGASVVSGRQKLTLATPFSTTGNLWVNSNSTATLQFTIFYTIAS